MGALVPPIHSDQMAMWCSTAWAPLASTKADTMKRISPAPAAASLIHMIRSPSLVDMFYLRSRIKTRTKQDQIFSPPLLYLTDRLFNLLVMNLDTAYSALADPTRRAILARLALGEATVGEIAEPFPISGPAISRHLKVLEEAQLIARTRRGQQFICSLNPLGLKTAQEWLDHYRVF